MEKAGCRPGKAYSPGGRQHRHLAFGALVSADSLAGACWLIFLLLNPEGDVLRLSQWVTSL